MNRMNRLDLRLIVFSKDDVTEGLTQLAKSVKTADVDPDSSGVISLSLARAARWTVRSEHDDSLPHKSPHIDPYSFNLWLIYFDRNELLQLLQQFIRAFPGQIDEEDFVPGAHDHVGGTGMNGPMGLWQLTRLHLEPPSEHRFQDTPIWRY